MKKQFFRVSVILLVVMLLMTIVGCGSNEPETQASGTQNNDFEGEPLSGTNETTSPAETFPTLAQALSGSLGDNITFLLDTDGTLTISGEGRMQGFTYGDGVVDTPWFDVREYIKAVVIEEGINNISAHTFLKCSNIESIIIPSTVYDIGGVSFAYCQSLKEIVIPEGETQIGNSTFAGCTSLTKIVLPESLTSISQDAFSSCGLTGIVIPDSVSFMGSSLFMWCTSLTEVQLPASLNEVMGYTFSNCKSLESIVIPDGVEEIGDKAFYKCSNLKEVTIPASVTYIGDDVFVECGELTIIGEAGSYAQTYAQNKGITFLEK